MDRADLRVWSMSRSALVRSVAYSTAKGGYKFRSNVVGLGYHEAWKYGVHIVVGSELTLID